MTDELRVSESELMREAYELLLELQRSMNPLSQQSPIEKATQSLLKRLLHHNSMQNDAKRGPYGSVAVTPKEKIGDEMNW